MKRVELHIERLVLRGVPPAQRDAVVARFTQALQAALAQPGAAQAWSQQGHLAGLRLPVATAAPAAPAAEGSETGWAAQAAQVLGRRGQAR